MRELKVRVLNNNRGIKEGTILKVDDPELSEDNLYNYSKDNEVNAIDEMGHICLGGVKALCDIDESDEHNWLFDGYEIIEIDGKKV